jgi:hypothetical protein
MTCKYIGRESKAFRAYYSSALCTLEFMDDEGLGNLASMVRQFRLDRVEFHGEIWVFCWENPGADVMAAHLNDATAQLEMLEIFAANAPGVDTRFVFNIPRLMGTEAAPVEWADDDDTECVIEEYDDGKD